MSATNYARNVVTREYVFLAQGEEPDPVHLGTPWVWFRIPGTAEQVLLIGESQGNRASRLKRGQA